MIKVFLQFITENEQWEWYKGNYIQPRLLMKLPVQKQSITYHLPIKMLERTPYKSTTGEGVIDVWQSLNLLPNLKLSKLKATSLEFSLQMLHVKLFQGWYHAFCPYFQGMVLKVADVSAQLCF